MTIQHPQTQRTRTHAQQVPGGYRLELDPASWVTLLGAIDRACQLEIIEGRGDGEARQRLEALRAALD